MSAVNQTPEEWYGVGNHFGALLRAATDALLLVDRNRRIRAANPAAERLTGYSEIELLDRNIEELVAPEWRRVRSAQLRMGQLVEDGRATSYEATLLDRVRRRIFVEGRSTPIRWQGRVIGTQELLRVRDLRDRPSTEARESEERFRGAFEAASIGMATVSPEGHFLEVNQSMCRIIGYSADELLSMTFQEVTHPDDLAANLQHVQEALAGEKRAYEMEKRYRRKDGSSVWILLSVSMVHGALGEPAYFVTQIQDIDDRKRAQLEAESLWADHPGASLLTRRELEVLGLVASGKTNHQAALILGLSPETISSHVQHSMRKLGAPTRTAAVVLALRLGMLRQL